MISDFSSKVEENCALVGYYAASSGDFLLKLRDQLFGPNCRSQELEMELIICLETSVRSYCCALRNNLKEHSSHNAFCWLSVVNWLSEFVIMATAIL